MKNLVIFLLIVFNYVVINISSDNEAFAELMSKNKNLLNNEARENPKKYKGLKDNSSPSRTSPPPLTSTGVRALRTSTVSYMPSMACRTMR